MIILLLWWIGGVIFRFLFSFVFDPDFNIKSSFARVVLSALIGIVPAYAFSKLGLAGWFPYLVMVAGGFLSQYALEWLNKRKG